MGVARVTHDGTCPVCQQRVGCYIPSQFHGDHEAVFPWRHKADTGGVTRVWCAGEHQLALDVAPRDVRVV